MILTTNRMTTIDPAFESRIDVTLAYQDLTKQARAEIWTNFVQILGPRAELSEDDVQQAAEYSLNGRQIKSAIKTASILAASEKIPLNLRHLKVVIGLRERSAKLRGDDV